MKEFKALYVIEDPKGRYWICTIREHKGEYIRSLFSKEEWKEAKKSGHRSIKVKDTFEPIINKALGKEGYYV